MLKAPSLCPDKWGNLLVDARVLPALCATARAPRRREALIGITLSITASASETGNAFETDEYGYQRTSPWLGTLGSHHLRCHQIRPSERGSG